MIQKITPINKVTEIRKQFEQKTIICAWCFKEQLVLVKEKTHSCSICGKTFYLSGNINIVA